MEDLILKAVTEFGFPALISVYLLTKGITALNNLTSSVADLTKTVEKLSGVNDRLDKIENILSSIEKNR